MAIATAAKQVIYGRDRLGIPDERLNVNGGAISIGHPYGMRGARMVDLTRPSRNQTGLSIFNHRRLRLSGVV